jgi:hypothetical protein
MREAIEKVLEKYLPCTCGGGWPDSNCPRHKQLKRCSFEIYREVKDAEEAMIYFAGLSIAFAAMAVLFLVIIMI